MEKKLDRDEVTRKLTEKMATRPCHRCNHDKFSVLPDFTSLSMQKDFNGPLVLGAPYMPLVVVGCNNCGAITLHASALLGITDVAGK